MSPIKIIAIILIALGVLALLYGGFTYTRETHETKLGPFELSVKDRETVTIPIWAGVIVTITGVAILLFSKKLT
jgi:uncharacterized membrane protein YidH (DUF202 family)